MSIAERIYQLSIPKTDKLMLFDLIDKLKPHERLKFELILAANPKRLVRMARDMQNARQLVEFNDIPGMFRELLFSMVMARIGEQRKLRATRQLTQ